MQFSEFHQALHAQYGEEAAAARHELYFLAQGRRFVLLYAVLAALRDAWLCWRLPRYATPVAAWAALATLPGSNGWGALAPCIADLGRRGISCSVLIHPRLRGQVAGQLPARPPASAWRHALSAWRLRLSGASSKPAVVSHWLVRCSLFRLRLWRGAWARTLMACSGATLLLHNDFDLYAVAAQQGMGSGWRSLCVQHGLPTDEFFPLRAHSHMLWGPSSAQVYARHSIPAQVFGYGPERASDLMSTAGLSAPDTLYLVSQTHTPVYGCALAPQFLALAQALAQMLPEGVALRILLHPEEVRTGHPYASSTVAAACCNPPHALLEGGHTVTPALVVGFCSTALLQAACHGHYVIGMDWVAPASIDAQAVGRPAMQVADAAALCDLIGHLCNAVSARAAFFQQQQQWLRRSFACDGDWPQRLGSKA